MFNNFSLNERDRTKVALFTYSILPLKVDYFYSLPLYYNVDTVVKCILFPNLLINSDYQYVLNDDQRPQLEGEYDNIEDYPNYQEGCKFSTLEDILLDMENKHNELIEENCYYFIYQAPDEILSKFFLGQDEVYNEKTKKYLYYENVLQVPISIRFPNCYFVIGDNCLIDVEGNPNGVLNRVFNLYRFYDVNVTYDYSWINNGWIYQNIPASQDIFIGGQQHSPVNGNFNYSLYFSNVPKQGFHPLFKDKNNLENSSFFTNVRSNNNPNLVLCVVDVDDLNSEYRYQEFKKCCENKSKKITVWRYDVEFNNEKQVYIGVIKKGKNDLDVLFQDLIIQSDCSLKKICFGACINKERWSSFLKTIYTIPMGKAIANQLKKKDFENLRLIDLFTNLVSDNFDLSYYIQTFYGIDENKCPGLPLAINVSKKDRFALVNIYWKPTKVRENETKYPPLPIKCIQLYGEQFIFPTRFMIENKFYENEDITDEKEKIFDKNNMSTQENYCAFISLNSQIQRLNFISTQNNRFLLDGEKNFVTSFLQLRILCANSFDKYEYLLVHNPRSYKNTEIPDLDWPIFRPGEHPNE